MVMFTTIKAYWTVGMVLRSVRPTHRHPDVLAKVRADGASVLVSRANPTGAVFGGTWILARLGQGDPFVKMLRRTSGAADRPGCTEMQSLAFGAHSWVHRYGQ